MNSLSNSRGHQPIDGPFIPPFAAETDEVSVTTGVQWRTKAEIATHFNCHIRTITKYMKRRILPYVKIGRWVRMDLVKCDAALKKFERQSKFHD